jgi:micrococcal nuclease
MALLIHLKISPNPSLPKRGNRPVPPLEKGDEGGFSKSLSSFSFVRKWRMSMTAIIITLLAAICFFSGELSCFAEKPEARFVRVVRVHDGDTVSVLIERRRERVRLIGIDAPEMGRRPWGAKAKRHLSELLSHDGWIVTLEFDVDRRDKYGRLLAYLRTPDGKLINLRMVKDGYAVLFTFPPNVKHVNAFRDGQNYAREKGLGIWGRDGLKEAPEDYRRRHPR